jgi:glycosyltransferase involved in cell wall biosynthesis
VTRSADVLLVSLGTTPGLRRADDALAALLADLGITCEMRRVSVGRAGALRRHPAVTDAVEALAARRTGTRVRASAVILSSVTTALLRRPPRVPYAVRFDAPAALNRPGAAGLWQRAAERRALPRASLLLPWGQAGARAASEGLGRSAPPSVPLPVPVDVPSAAGDRDLAAVAYAGYPRKRGLDLLCAAWTAAARPGERLVVGGLERARGLAWLERCGVPEPEGVQWAGALPRMEWLAIVARARVFVNASRWEDHGLAQLEALAAGTPLVTVPSPGAYEALEPARELSPALAAADLSAAGLAGAMRAGLDLGRAAREAYGARAAVLMAPYRPVAVRETLARRILPELGLGTA